MDLSKVKKIYFIGIAGIGMSAVAAIAKQLGFEVSGSDNSAYPPSTDILKQNGIPFFSDYDSNNIQNPDLVVMGAAEDPVKNPEVKEVIKSEIPHISFAELLYLFTEGKYRIVVAGTHGKTTTASLIANALAVVSKKPGFLIGGYVRDFETNFAISQSQYFVIEGDEYYSSYFDKRPKFLHYHPSMMVITSLDMDHYDFYKNMNDLMDKFKKCIKAMPPEGVIVACHDDNNVKKLLRDCDKKIIWYGFKGSRIRWKGINTRYSDEFMEFQAKNLETKEQTLVKLQIVGEHNALNCLALLSVMEQLGFSLNDYSQSLEKFQGSRRRFEIRGIVNGITVIDDYAHHPTEVKATLAAAKAKYPNRKIWAVFEPHTISRTKATLNELAQAFSSADVVIIPDIYPARETSVKNDITGRMVVDEIKKYHHNAYYISSGEKVVDYLKEHVIQNDIVIVMAVGSFNQVADLFLNKHGNV